MQGSNIGGFRRIHSELGRIHSKGYKRKDWLLGGWSILGTYSKTTQYQINIREKRAIYEIEDNE